MTDNLFLFHDENAAFLKDRSQKIRVQPPATRFWIGWVVTILFVTVPGLTTTIDAFRLYVQLNRGMRTTTAHYTEKYTEPDDNGRIKYYLAFTFEVNDRWYDHTEAVRQSFYDNAHVEDPVKIKYKPDLPERSWIVANRKPPYGELLFTVVMLAALFGAGTKLRQLYGEVARLQNDSDIIYGQVVASHDYEDSDDDRWLEVKYQFTEPGTSRVLEKTQKSLNNEKRVPEEGERVAVVYLNRRTYSIL